MELNWSPEVIIDFIVATIILISALLSYYSPRTKKIKSLFYIRLSFIIAALFLYFEGLSFLFMSIFINQIHAVLLVPCLLFFIIGFNYTMKDSFYSIDLILVFGLGILYIYLALQPDVYLAVMEEGYPTIIWTGLFNILGVILQFLLFFYIFYWGLKTWKNAPFLIKKEASLFFFGIILGGPIHFIIYIFAYWIPNLILLADIIGAIAAFIFIIAIIREPKLLYILPYTIHRILVKDRGGYPLFDHDWSESDISETLFTGFINAVQTMSEEIMHIGGLLDINLQEGILIVHDSEYITVGLVASKSSKLLNDSLRNFSLDFEVMFAKLLKKTCRDMSEYESAYLLIEKHFSNFPYRIIPTRQHTLLLSGKYLEIPFELDNKLNTIFTDEGEYENMKSELSKAPIGVFPEFLDLYNELKEEINENSQEDNKDSALKMNDK